MIWDRVSELAASGAPLFGFVHGLTFFSLGVVVVVLVPRAGRLEVARRFPLLALFAFCQAIVAWSGALVIGPDVEESLLALGRTGVMGVGYVSLLAFGLLTPVSSGTRFRAHVAMVVMLGGGWALSLGALLALGVSTVQVVTWGERLARLGFALPGGLLAVWGVRQQTYRTMDGRLLHSFRTPMRLARVGIGLFGVLSGLEAVVDGVALSLSLLYAACGADLALNVARALSAVQQEIELWVENVERSQALLADRERISRDLHDGTIQAIYAAGLMIEGALQTLAEDPPASREQLARVMTSLNQTIQDIRRYIFNLRGDVSDVDLQEGLADLLRDFRLNTLLETELEVVGEETWPLRSERRNHILQIAREALSNTARHARARKVALRLTYRIDSLELVIADDGVGFGRYPNPNGQGMRNIHERVRMLESELDVQSTPNRGVTMTLRVPY